MVRPTETAKITFGQIDFKDPIFESIRRDYPDHDSWVKHAFLTADSRCAIVVHGSSKSYSGVVILKSGEGPDGPSPEALKISTFKVAPEAEAQGIADLLLARVFEHAIEQKTSLIFATVLPNHEDLARYLELRGFRRGPQELARGERVYVADLMHPERIYLGVNRLAYDLLAEEYSSRSEALGANEESPEYLAGLLGTRLRKDAFRILELGPGSGTVLAALGKFANETVAVEISPKMARIAQSRAPQSLILVGSILAFDFMKDSFDGIYAGAFLHLFPQSDAARLIQRIALWTKPDGSVFVNTSVSDQHKESIELKADYLHRVARFRSRWTEEQFRSLLECNGLQVRERITTDERERQKFWVAFLCTPRKEFVR